MGELRIRMIRDMTVRGFAARTHKAYLAAVVRLAKHYRRSPAQITDDEIQTYLAYLIQDRKLSWSTCSQAANAFRFLYHVTLGRPRTAFCVPLPKQPQKLPEILSREEVWRLLTASPHPRHRLLLTTIYAAGLRVSEAIALKVSDIDADRMTIRIEQGERGQGPLRPPCQALAPRPPRILADDAAAPLGLRQSAGHAADRRHRRPEDLVGHLHIE
jgi:integrase/recombinase XerD